MWLLILLLYPLHTFASGTECQGESIYNGDGSVRSYAHDRPATCVYVLKSSSTWIRLRWTYFNVKGRMPLCGGGDFIVVKSGCSSPKQTIGKFCSSNMKALPHDIYARGCITIVYRTSGWSHGFRGKYQSFGLDDFELSSKDHFSTCHPSGFDIDKPSGVIGSPEWPNTFRNKYGYRTNVDECIWDINSGNSGKRISLNIMDMNLPTNDLNSCYDFIYVMIKGKKSASLITDDQYYCTSDTRERTLNTNYYALQIKLRGTFEFNLVERGFLIGFVVYDDAEEGKSVPIWALVVGILAVILLLIAATFLCYKKYRHQRHTPEDTPLQAANVEVTPPHHFTLEGSSLPAPPIVTPPAVRVMGQPDLPQPFNIPPYPPVEATPMLPPVIPYPHPAPSAPPMILSLSPSPHASHPTMQPVSIQTPGLPPPPSYEEVRQGYPLFPPSQGYIA